MVQGMWDARHTIQAEKKVCRSAGIMGHLRGGGWGARHLSQSYVLAIFTRRRYTDRKRAHSCGECSCVLLQSLLEPQRIDQNSGQCFGIVNRRSHHGINLSCSVRRRGCSCGAAIHEAAQSLRRRWGGTGEGNAQTLTSSNIESGRECGTPGISHVPVLPMEFRDQPRLQNKACILHSLSVVTGGPLEHERRISKAWSALHAHRARPTAKCLSLWTGHIKLVRRRAASVSYLCDAVILSA